MTNLSRIRQTTSQNLILLHTYKEGYILNNIYIHTQLERAYRSWMKDRNTTQVEHVGNYYDGVINWTMLSEINKLMPSLVSTMLGLRFNLQDVVKTMTLSFFFS